MLARAISLLRRVSGAVIPRIRAGLRVLARPIRPPRPVVGSLAALRVSCYVGNVNSSRGSGPFWPKVVLSVRTSWMAGCITGRRVRWTNPNSELEAQGPCVRAIVDLTVDVE